MDNPNLPQSDLFYKSANVQAAADDAEPQQAKKLHVCLLSAGAVSEEAVAPGASSNSEKIESLIDALIRRLEWQERQGELRTARREARRKKQEEECE